VIVFWPGLLVVVEVKHRSGNERKPGYAGFRRYLDRLDLFAAQPTEVESLGYYELTRNWRIGAELAEQLSADFVLLNLGPPALAGDALAFGAQLTQGGERRFAHQTWTELLAGVGADTPEWLAEFAAARKLR
jgi:hypothetical protein